jgi:anti-anti-sigma regulatory factor
MLRVITEREADRTTLRVMGRFSGQWVDEVTRCWTALREADPAKPITINLVDVSFIDARGAQLLERMCRAGAQVIAAGCMNMQIVRQILHRVASGER